MGALLPYDTDRQIVAKLNWRFSDDRFEEIVTHVRTKENIFDDPTKHHLHRIAYRLRIWPDITKKTRSPRGRWFYFLKSWLSDENRQDIMETLSEATTDANCIGVVFQVMQDPNLMVDPTLPTNRQYAVLNEQTPAPGDAGAGKVLYCLTLVCRDDLDTADKQGIADPDDHSGETDGGEQKFSWE